MYFNNLLLIFVIKFTKKKNLMENDNKVKTPMYTSKVLTKTTIDYICP